MDGTFVDDWARHSHATGASLDTAAPSLATRTTHIETPSTYEPPHICGYVQFESYNPYTCASHKTYLWNSHLKVVGCGNPTPINYITSCVPYRALQECYADCLANPVQYDASESDLPHCVTSRVGPEASYSILHCQSTYHEEPFHVHMTYHGQTTIEHLPRWLGDDANITYATRIPHITVKTTGTGGFMLQETQTLYSTFLSAGVALTKSIASLAATAKGEVEWETHCSKSDGVEVGSYVQQQKHKEIVAGSVIGGVYGAGYCDSCRWNFVSWRRKLKGEVRGK